jgi:hypothetical protein
LFCFSYPPTLFSFNFGFYSYIFLALSLHGGLDTGLKALLCNWGLWSLWTYVLLSNIDRFYELPMTSLVTSMLEFFDVFYGCLSARGWHGLTAHGGIADW